jgi:hypothetical protein
MWMKRFTEFRLLHFIAFSYISEKTPYGEISFETTKTHPKVFVVPKMVAQAGFEPAV